MLKKASSNSNQKIYLNDDSLLRLFTSEYFTIDMHI